ncbi:zinc-dependent alcohol dehydrogenase [Pyrolobus fumarii]|nr:alcohol dehydrogenase catalytic domain-containing protein [Pyrolobus fumarii]
MRIAVLQEPFSIVLREVEVPKLDSRSVLVRVASCALSGTDVRIYKGVVKTRLPIVLGQEFSGVVVEVGDEVEGVSRGEKVVVEPVLYCGKCVYCRRGLYTLCEQVKVLGVNSDGGLAEYVKVPAYAVHRVPAGLSLEEACLTVPVAVALHAVRRAGVGIGDNVLVFGAGAIGLSALQLARLSGADRVVVVEPVESKRRLAERLGAHETLSPRDMEALGDGAERRLGRFDVVIETSGSVDALRHALMLVGKRGRIVVVGAYGREARLLVDLVVRREVTVTGSWLYPHVFRKALDAIARGIVSVKEYISGRYPLARIEEAFREALKPENIRIIVQP